MEKNEYRDPEKDVLDVFGMISADYNCLFDQSDSLLPILKNK